MKFAKLCFFSMSGYKDTIRPIPVRVRVVMPLQAEPRYNIIYGTQRYLCYSKVYVIVNMGMSHGNMYLKMIVSAS